MLDELKDVFRKVIELSEKRKKAMTDSREDYELRVTDIDNLIEKAMVESEEDRNLREYLESLDYETIKTLQIVMYLGRDQNYNENDTPEELFRKMREHFDELGWHEDKELEINQMIEKAPLDKYLKDGLRILKITI